MSAVIKGDIPSGKYDRLRTEGGSTTILERREQEANIFTLDLRSILEDYEGSRESARQQAERSSRFLRENLDPLSRAAVDLAPSTETPHDSESNTANPKTMSELTRDELDAKLERTEARVEAAIARLESQFGELRGEIGEIKGEMRAEARHNSRLHQITWAVISIFAVLAIGGAGFVFEGMNARTDRIERQVDALPTELRGIADSITSAITATQSGQPPVIVIERPAEPGAADE